MMDNNNFAQASMMIRKPIDQVFNAFINPEITTKFWFTKSSGSLEVGKKIDWVWEMYQITVPVLVKEIEPNQRILIEWGSGKQLSNVEWKFQSLTENKTFVTVNNYGIQSSSPDDLLNQVRDSTGGFTIVLAGLKAYLEHGIELDLVLDKWPKELH